MRTHGSADAQKSAGRRAGLPPVRGWLLVYSAVLAILTLHGAALTIASVVVYLHPAIAGMHSRVPLNSLLFYVTANSVLILYVEFSR